MNAIVYDPPAPGFPYLAVVFKSDGEVLVARSVPSREAGEDMIEEVFEEFSKRNNVPTRSKTIR